MPRRFKIDRTKLSELILYFARRCDMQSSWGKTKLCKMLFHADFEAFRKYSQPITGAPYFRMPQGPVAKAALAMIDELVASGRLALIDREVGDYREKRPTAIAEPNVSVFSANEMSVIEQAVALLSPMNARQISKWSHDQPGWGLVEADEEIPYCLGLGSVRKPTTEETDYYRSKLAYSTKWTESQS